MCIQALDDSRMGLKGLIVAHAKCALSVLALRTALYSDTPPAVKYTFKKVNRSTIMTSGESELAYLRRCMDRP